MARLVPSKLMKTKWFPQPHAHTNTCGFGLETAAANSATILPITIHDEGLGTPSDIETNPENANFAVNTSPNCHADSRVDTILTEINLSLTKGALETDKIHALKFAYMPIYTAFIDDYTAIDELTSAEIQDYLMLQTESTDRQGFPLWNGVKMLVPIANQQLLHANVPGLTTTQGIEGVTFNQHNYYNMLHYYTNKGKLKSVQGGLKWGTLTQRFPTARIRIRQRPDTKAQNPYTFFGVLVFVPSSDDLHQIPIASETTNITHVKMFSYSRFNEWNADFNFKKI